jgi:hypothetical protein
MSVFISNPILFNAYTNSLQPQLFLSTTYALTGENVYVQFKPPIITQNDKFIKYVVSYSVNFGDDLYYQPVDATIGNITIPYTYNQAGIYYVTYIATYTDGKQETFIIQNPFIIKNNWDVFNQQQVRLNNEIVLNLPYNLEQINIQPNEWGVEDIFNTSILRLQENLDYLISNTQIININVPSDYFGWLGSNYETKAFGIQWFTKNYNPEYYNNPELSINDGISYFSNLKDSLEVSTYLYILDDRNIRIFNNDANPDEIIFNNYDKVKDIFKNPVSFDINDAGDFVYIVDNPTNKIYSLNIDLTSNYINVDLVMGGYGGVNNHSKFNSPIEISYTNGSLYIVDYNNSCIKQYNKDLNWLYTYTNDTLDFEKPVSVSVNSKNNLVYVLTETYMVYIYDNFSNELYESFTVNEANDASILKKIVFDSVGEFIYIQTEQGVYKYTASGFYINVLNISKTIDTKYINMRKANNRGFFITSKYCIFKCQDNLELFMLGDGLPKNYWNTNQLKVKKEEFSTDINYNRSLIRIAQNIKSFRNTLNAKFNLLTEQTPFGTKNYFSWIPVNKTEIPLFESDVENETLGVGINELHTPPVFNRELLKLYNALNSLADFLTIKNVKTKNLQCAETFCWSWKAMSCYDLTLPTIKGCEINPITYQELKSNFPITYAPTTTWAEASSICCHL